jgi:hypothetical protein
MNSAKLSRTSFATSDSRVLLMPVISRGVPGCFASMLLLQRWPRSGFDAEVRTESCFWSSGLGLLLGVGANDWNGRVSGKLEIRKQELERRDPLGSPHCCRPIGMSAAGSPPSRAPAPCPLPCSGSRCRSRRPPQSPAGSWMVGPPGASMALEG